MCAELQGSAGEQVSVFTFPPTHEERIGTRHGLVIWTIASPDGREAWERINLWRTYQGRDGGAVLLDLTLTAGGRERARAVGQAAVLWLQLLGAVTALRLRVELLAGCCRGERARRRRTP